MSWKKAREFIPHISLILFALGVYWTITGGYWVLQTTGFLNKNISMDTLSSWAGAWNYWFLGIGLILMGVGGWYFFDTIRKRRKFEEYIHSESKREFVNNLRELEEIAYKLGERYENRLEEKKKKWKVK
ncbi:MAG TPA: DUF3198 domain-containing protein [Candidatus Aciduliprofundum boonei]|uniref:DUF3198 domain-containing protein n=1 Tax=Candidatus Aciduliprofundum boonei TaxID=379547 RepID=A0A7J3TA20_9ARCH|nr:DUF3198 domain-containing protein [Candidatus Aciduliprofundum boonei]